MPSRTCSKRVIRSRCKFSAAASPRLFFAGVLSRLGFRRPDVRPENAGVAVVVESADGSNDLQSLACRIPAEKYGSANSGQEKLELLHL